MSEKETRLLGRCLEEESTEPRHSRNSRRGHVWGGSGRASWIWTYGEGGAIGGGYSTGRHRVALEKRMGWRVLRSSVWLEQRWRDGEYSCPLVSMGGTGPRTPHGYRNLRMLKSFM